MKRCPACGTVYSVAQGFCPMDGAALAEDAAPSPAAGSAGPGGPVGTAGAAGTAAWDPPRAPADAPANVVGPGRAGPATRIAAFSPVLGPGTTAGGFAVPPQARPAPAPESLPPTSDPAETGTAFIPPLAPPGAVRMSPVQAAPAPAPARTVMAFVPPGAREAARPKSDPGPAAAAIIPKLSSGPAAAAPFTAPPSTAGSGASGLASVPSVAAIPSSNNGVQVEGAFFPAGGLARPRSDGPAPNSWEESLIGRVLDQRYRIESCIGAGGMGVVYKATHVIIDKPLAIKMLRAEVANQPDIIKRFLLEAQLASRVKHPNVVDISDYGQIAGQTAYYVMEYLVGETLAHRIDTGGRVEPAQAVDIAIQTAQALQAAHAGKIIHRDLKSENIFLCERPDGSVQAKILDFGIARIRDKKTRLTAMGALIGTPAYMSPEQAQGADVDERSDLYALGVIMFEMFAGRVPFKAPTVAMILSAQIFDAPPRLHEVDASVPDLPNLEHVIHTLLAKNRDERPRDATEVIHLIKTAAEQDLAPPSAGPASSGAAKRRPTVTIGSWSVAENPSGLQRLDNTAPAVAGEARSTPRPDADVVVARPVSASGRIQRRPSVIVPSGTHVERIAAPPTRSPITGEQEVRHFPTGVNQTVRSAGPPMILIIAAAASIGAAITVTLYKVWRRNQAPIAVQQPVEQPSASVAMTRLTFDSEPAGATVYTEAGERWGVTPFTRELAPTSPRTRVIFKLAGHDDAPLDVTAGESVRHKVLLRPRLAEPAPAPVMAPAPEGATAANGLGTASADPPAADPVKAVVASKATPSTKPAKTKPDAASKAPAATSGTPPPPATPTDDGEPDDLNMGELKNPFRKK